MLAFPVAVIKKFGDDRAGQLAALLAYYGFFSLFPLLLLFATGVAIVARDDPDLRRRLLESALQQFPVVGTRIGESVRELTGSSFALIVGIVGAIWSGTAVVSAAQQAMDDVWDVPRVERPGLPVPDAARAAPARGVRRLDRAVDVPRRHRRGNGMERGDPEGPVPRRAPSSSRSRCSRSPTGSSRSRRCSGETCCPARSSPRWHGRSCCSSGAGSSISTSAMRRRSTDSSRS